MPMHPRLLILKSLSLSLCHSLLRHVATRLPAELHQMHILIPESQSLALLPYVPSHTTVHFHPNTPGTSSSISLEPTLLERGWTRIASAGASSHADASIISFTSPLNQSHQQPASSSSSSTTTPSSAPSGGTVKLLKKRPTNKAQKSSIWAAHSPMLEEPEKLLTAEDKKRPECVFPDPADGQRKRRKRA